MHRCRRPDTDTHTRHKHTHRQPLIQRQPTQFARLHLAAVLLFGKTRQRRQHQIHACNASRRCMRHPHAPQHSKNQQIPHYGIQLCRMNRHAPQMAQRRYARTGVMHAQPQGRKHGPAMAATLHQTTQPAYGLRQRCRSRKGRHHGRTDGPIVYRQRDRRCSRPKQKAVIAKRARQGAAALQPISPGTCGKNGHHKYRSHGRKQLRPQQPRRQQNAHACCQARPDRMVDDAHRPDLYRAPGIGKSLAAAHQCGPDGLMVPARQRQHHARRNIQHSMCPHQNATDTRSHYQRPPQPRPARKTHLQAQGSQCGPHHVERRACQPIGIPCTVHLHQPSRQSCVRTG